MKPKTFFFLSSSQKIMRGKKTFFRFGFFFCPQKLFYQKAFFLSEKSVFRWALFVSTSNSSKIKKKKFFLSFFNLSRDTATGCAGKKLLKWVEKIIQPCFGHHRRIVPPGNVFFFCKVLFPNFWFSSVQGIIKTFWVILSGVWTTSKTPKGRRCIFDLFFQYF